jgi:hypothetical protein
MINKKLARVPPPGVNSLTDGVCRTDRRSIEKKVDFTLPPLQILRMRLSKINISLFQLLCFPIREQSNSPPRAIFFNALESRKSTMFIHCNIAKFEDFHMGASFFRDLWW